MERIFAVNTNTYHGFTVDDALEGIARAGFRYVEIAAVRNWTEHIMPDMPDAEIERIQAKAKSLGLTFIGMSGHCNLMDAERLNDFRANMALAHRLGCKYIVSSTGEAHFGKDEKFADDVLAANIKALIPYLEKYNMTLAIETHGEYGTGESIYNVTKLTGSDRAGVCYDTANCVFYGGVRPEEEVLKCLPALKYVHLKDKVGYDNVWNFPAVGKGELKLAEFIKLVEEHGFDGPYSIEIEYTADFTNRPKVPEDLNVQNQAVQDSYDHLHSLGLI